MIRRVGRNSSEFRHKSRVILGAVSMISLGAGCAAITGLGDYGIDDGNPDASLLPSEAGEGGGTGGKSSGSSGTSGSSGSSGSSGTSGSEGTSGTTPSPPDDSGTSGTDSGHPSVVCGQKTCPSASGFPGPGPGPSSCSLESCSNPGMGWQTPPQVSFQDGRCSISTSGRFLSRQLPAKPPFEFTLRFTYQDKVGTDGVLALISSESGGAGGWNLTINFGASQAQMCNSALTCTPKTVVGVNADYDFLIYGKVPASGDGTATFSVGNGTCNPIGSVPLTLDKSEKYVFAEVGCVTGTCNVQYDDLVLSVTEED